MLARVTKTIRNNIIVGLILVTPIAVTAFIANWLFTLTTDLVIGFVPRSVRSTYPLTVSPWIALLLMTMVLFLIGLLARNILGKKLYQLGDMILGRIPVLNKTGRVPPQNVTQLAEPDKHKEFHAVFVPTSPNPTSGLIIFVPRDDMHPLPLTVQDAMKLIVSGGAVFPGSGPIDDRPTLLDKLEEWMARQDRSDARKTRAGDSQSLPDKP